MKRDPIELELFRHLLVSIAEEMGAVLRKTSYSANIKERRDYSCAVYDAEGETVAMGDHMPVHLGRDAAVGAARDGGVRSRTGRRRHCERSVSRRHASARYHGSLGRFRAWHAQAGLLSLPIARITPTSAA